MNDERLILNTLSDFPRMVDRKDWGSINKIFSENVQFNYGEGSEQQGLDALLIQFKKFHDRCSSMQHMLGSIRLDHEGDSATTYAYVVAYHQGKGDRAHFIFNTHGEYVDQWQRQADGWRIVRRDASWAMLVGDRSVLFDQ
jgi:hypothetical protein